MNKEIAILVIDMPEIDKDTKKGCRNCKYAEKRMTLSEEYLCSITGQAAYVYDMNCPLKPLPQKIVDGRIWFEDTGPDGYNACIDEILGGSNE